MRISPALPLAAILLLSGCASNLATNATSSISQTAVSSNWQFTPVDDFFHNDQLGSLSGSISVQGSTYSAVLRGTGACVSPLQDITFTGSLDSAGTLTLTSTNLPNNIATISGHFVAGSGNTSLMSSVAVTGSGGCTMAPYLVFPGQQYPPLSGSYTAALTSGTGTATLAATLTAAAPNSDGQFPESGTVTLTSGSCTTAFTFSGTASGSSLTGTLTAANNTAAFTGQLSTSGPLVPLTLTATGPGCAAGTFTGNLH